MSEKFSDNGMPPMILNLHIEKRFPEFVTNSNKKAQLEVSNSRLVAKDLRDQVIIQEMIQESQSDKHL